MWDRADGAMGRICICNKSCLLAAGISILTLVRVRCTLQIGDIPDAELTPPENVLFVCKLNPVTEVNSYTAFKLFLECCTLKVRVQEGSVDFRTRCDCVVSSFCYSH